jgi:hypothetical protein
MVHVMRIQKEAVGNLTQNTWLEKCGSERQDYCTPSTSPLYHQYTISYCMLSKG